jgi:hypothetical protein
VEVAVAVELDDSPKKASSADAESFDNGRVELVVGAAFVAVEAAAAPLMGAEGGDRIMLPLALVPVLVTGTGVEVAAADL